MRVLKKTADPEADRTRDKIDMNDAAIHKKALMLLEAKGAPRPQVRSAVKGQIVQLEKPIETHS